MADTLVTEERTALPRSTQGVRMPCSVMIVLLSIPTGMAATDFVIPQRNSIDF